MAASTPPQASKRAGVNVSTPSHLNQASPTATRYVAGKTPVNHPTTGSTGSKGLGSTPMVQNLSQTGFTSSPSANMLTFHTPGELAAAGATPAGLHMPTPGLGGTAMMPTMSELGLTASGPKRNEDEERRAKVRKVLRSIGKPKGRVSEEGIARVGRRVGLQNDIDVDKLIGEELERKAGNRAISTAGSNIVIDLILKDNVPQSVSVNFSKASEAVSAQEPVIARLLLDNLKPPNGVQLQGKLDDYARNLGRLARLDKLSIPGVNCFEALTGIYSSLRRLYDQELHLTGTLLGESTAENKADVEVSRKKSGKPVMHGRGEIGLEVLYWCDDSRLMLPDNSNDDSIFALRLEVAASPAGLYPSLRVSDTWLPDPLTIPDADSGDGLPWQDPPPTSTAQTGDESAMAIDGEQKLPDLRFMAKLDPPLVMPYSTAMNILSAVDSAPPTTMTLPPQYAALLLNEHGTLQSQPSNGRFVATAEQTVLSQRNGNETIVSHKYTLNAVKPDYGFVLEEIPFSHPRQLVQLLPTLRLWAAIGRLLRSALLGGETIDGGNQQQSGDTTHQNPGRDYASSRNDPSSTTQSAGSHDATHVDISLVTSPVPTLGFTFPNLADTNVSSVNIQFLPNAEIIVTQHDGLSLPETMTADNRGRKLAKALDVCGDIGVWIEWMRTQT